MNWHESMNYSHKFTFEGKSFLAEFQIEKDGPHFLLQMNLWAEDLSTTVRSVSSSTARGTKKDMMALAEARLSHWKKGQHPDVVEITHKL